MVMSLKGDVGGLRRLVAAVAALCRSFSSRVGAPKAAEGGLRVVGSRALGLGRLGYGLRETILGGRVVLLAGAGVVGSVAKVFMVSISGEEFLVGVMEVLVGGGLIEKSKRQETASISSSSVLHFTFLKKGDSDLGLITPLPGLP